MSWIHMCASPLSDVRLALCSVKDYAICTKHCGVEDASWHSPLGTHTHTHPHTHAHAHAHTNTHTHTHTHTLSLSLSHTHTHTHSHTHTHTHSYRCSLVHSTSACACVRICIRDFVCMLVHTHMHARGNIMRDISLWLCACRMPVYAQIYWSTIITIHILMHAAFWTACRDIWVLCHCLLGLRRNVHVVWLDGAWFVLSHGAWQSYQAFSSIATTGMRDLC
jgi:hypothetical protein